MWVWRYQHSRFSSILMQWFLHYSSAELSFNYQVGSGKLILHERECKDDVILSCYDDSHSLLQVAGLKVEVWANYSSMMSAIIIVAVLGTLVNLNYRYLTNVIFKCTKIIIYSEIILTIQHDITKKLWVKKKKFPVDSCTSTKHTLTKLKYSTKIDQ